MSLTKEIYKINLNNFELKLFSSIIKYVHCKLDKILITSVAGDVIELSIDDKSFEAKRINSIIKIEGSINCLNITDELNGQIIYGGNSEVLAMIDMESNEISDLYTIGHKISSIDCIGTDEGSFKVAVGCENGDLFIRENWNNFIEPIKISSGKALTDVRFGSDHRTLIICSQDKNVYIYTLENDEYTKTKNFLIDSAFPSCINFNDDFSKILVTTNQWKFILLNMKNLQVSNAIEDISCSLWTTWEGKYPINPKSFSIISNSISLAHKRNFIAASDELNNLHFWKTNLEIKKNTSKILRAHSSHIQKVKLSSDDKFLITGGYQDNMICKWKIKEIANDEGMSLPEFKEGVKYLDEVMIDNIFLISELNYSFADISKQTTSLSDNGVVVKGFVSKTLNTIFSRRLNPIEIEMMNRPANTSLTIEFIYGPHVCERRNSVTYLHVYKKKSQDLSRVGVNMNMDLLQKILNEDYEKKSINELVKMINISKIRENDIHHYCTRYVIYFNSRFIIILNPIKNSQKIYQGHQNRVSTLAMNPNKKLIASGDVSNKPVINIWRYDTLETVKQIKTGHNNGIFHLAFSYKGSYLLSIAFDTMFSLQLFMVDQNLTPIFINTGTFPIFFVKFFYSTENKFVTMGYRHAIIWKIKGNTLRQIKHLETEETKVNEKTKQVEFKTFLCADFLDFQMGNSIESDIIMGSNFGDITGFSCNKYILIKSNAHQGAVNCIKITNLIQDRKYVIFSAGEDNYIKVWNNSFQNINVIDVLQFNTIKQKNLKMIHRGVQSLDIYGCDKGGVFLLIGLRSGDLIELDVKDKTILIDSTAQKVEKETSKQNNYNIEVRHVYSYPYSLTLGSKNFRVVYAVHPTLPIVVIVSADHTIRFYDFDRKELILSTDLGSGATCVSFSPDGNYLVIGLITGVVMIINSHMTENSSGFGQQYFLPKLEPLQSISNANTAVVLVKFSNYGDFLAISYDNKRTKDGKAVGGSFVSIFMMRLSKKSLPIAVKKNNSNDLFIKITDISVPLSQYEITNLNRNECASTSIDFSDDSLFVLISNQKLGDNLAKEISNESTFMVWDIKLNQLVLDPESLKIIRFSKFSVSNGLFARNLSSLYNDKSEDESDLLVLSSVNHIPSKNIIISGSVDGNLHIFKALAISLDSNSLYTHSPNNLNLKEMTHCRGFPAHTNELLKIEISTNERYLFTSSLTEQCVIQWVILSENALWDLDFFPIKTEDDPFMEIISRDFLKILNEELWIHRQNLTDLYNNLPPDSSANIELINIIGRRSVDRRNNLKYDMNNRLIYSSSSYIVYLSLGSGSLLQDFLLPQENLLENVQQEISCFCLSGRDIAVALTGVTSCVSIWELNTKINVSKTYIPMCAVINQIKFSSNKNKIIGWGLHRLYYPVVFILNVMQSELIASALLMHTPCFKIKDLDFIGKTSDQFLTLGIQHLTLWSLVGQRLEYSNIPLNFGSDNYKNLEGDKDKEVNIIPDDNKFGIYLLEDKSKVDNVVKYYREEPDKDLKVTFLSIVFYKSNGIISGDDGYLYTMDKLQLVERRKFHNAPITVLDINPDAMMLASGCMDGRVIIHKVDIDSKEKIRNLPLLKVFYTYESDIPAREILLNPFYNVQSVCLGINKLAVGTRSGHILEFKISDDLKVINPDSYKDAINYINFQDHDACISIAVDMNSTRVFSISPKGLLNVWDINTLKMVHSYDYHIKSFMIYHFRYQSKLLIAFEYNIIILNTSIDQGDLKQIYVSIPQFDLQTGKITDLKISPNEKILAIASITNSIPVVSIYDIVQGFLLKNIAQNFNSSIKYIDFSLDSNFLLIEDNLDEVIVIEVHLKKAIQISELNFEIDWLNEGLKYSDKIKAIHVAFGDQMNRITKIVKHPLGNIVAVGDELGIVRFFNYPGTENDSYFACKTDHVGKVTNMIFSHDQKYFLTCSEYDRCIFIYKILN